MVALFIALVIAPAQNLQSVQTVSQLQVGLLERAFLQRMGFETARFKIRVVHTKRDRLPHVQNLEINLADNDWTIRNTGDDHGLVYPPQAGQVDEGAQVGVGGAFVPLIHFLNGKERNWFSFADGARSVVYTPGHILPTFVDPRTYGLRAIVVQGRSPKEMADIMTTASGTIRYSEKALKNGIVRVSGHQPARSPKGREFDFEWDIDTKNGPTVVAVREFVIHPDGRRELAAEATNNLSLIEGRWWPMRTEIKVYSTGRSFSVEFLSVEFDHQEHAKRLSPDSIGIPVGLPVRMAGETGKFFYAGKGKIIDEATFERDKSKFDLAPLSAHTLQARIRGFGQFPAWWNSTDGLYGLEGVADRPDLWELYVRRWVMKRSPNSAEYVIEPLTDEQKTAARGVLDDCRKRAQPVRMKLDAELAKLGKEIATQERALGISTEPSPLGEKQDGLQVVTGSERPVKVGQPPSGKDNVKALATLRARRGELEHSVEIQRLFDELKLRLDGLLTSRQRDPNSIAPIVPKPPRMATRAPATP